MFNPRNQKPNDHIPILDPVTNSDYSYNLRNRPRNEVESVQFRVQESLNHVNYGDESGVSSPPLWKNSHQLNPVHPLQVSTNYRSNSTSSRASAIAKGQFELMEMVKNMPESCYELSLKDLVEQNMVLESDQEECLISKEEENFTNTTSIEQQTVKSIQRQESNSNKNNKGKTIRSENFENQSLFLKMFFPISLESKKKNLKRSPKTSTKVSPKPEGSVKSSKNVEKDWWKRRFSCSSESDSSRTGSSNSESSGSSGNNNTSSRTGSSNSESTDRSGSSGSRKSRYRKKKGFLSSCWSRSYFSKSKSAE